MGGPGESWCLLSVLAIQAVKRLKLTGTLNVHKIPPTPPCVVCFSAWGSVSVWRFSFCNCFGTQLPLEYCCSADAAQNCLTSQ